jgi:hypothetical protein
MPLPRPYWELEPRGYTSAELKQKQKEFQIEREAKRTELTTSASIKKRTPTTKHDKLITRIKAFEMDIPKEMVDELKAQEASRKRMEKAAMQCKYYAKGHGNNSKLI